MALRRAAAKRLTAFTAASGGGQRTIHSPLISTLLYRQEQTSPVTHELGNQSKGFRCTAASGAAEPHLYSRPSSQASQLASDPISSSKRSGKKGGRGGDGAAQRAKIQERPIVFECQECEALCVKRVQQDKLDNGVVIVRCLECRSVNLIADHLGLFKDEGSMHKFLSERGVDVIHGPENSYELLHEDLVQMAEMDEEKQRQQQQQELTTGA